MEMVREFRDADGRLWQAGYGYREGLDYQGRYYLCFRPAEGGDGAQGGAVVSLQDVRWNSEHTVLRRLETFSEVELRRRLRSAVGRAAEGARS